MSKKILSQTKITTLSKNHKRQIKKLLIDHWHVCHPKEQIPSALLADIHWIIGLTNSNAKLQSIWPELSQLLDTEFVLPEITVSSTFHKHPIFQNLNVQLCLVEGVTKTCI